MARALTAVLAVSLLAVAAGSSAGAQAPRVGGTLVFGTQGAGGGLREPPCLNVIRETTCITTGLLTPSISQKVLLGAFEARPDHTWRPSLVSHVDYTTKRPFTLTYHIRPEARWSDGVPIAARDFVFTDRVIRALTAEQLTTWHVDHVRSVRAVDAKTVRVVLRFRFADWRGLFGTVLPSHALSGRNPARIWNEGIENPKTGEPIGSGPFLVERWERGTQIALRRNANYWRRRARLDRLVIRYRMSSLDPVEWLRSGEVDVAQHFRVTGVPDLRAVPGVRIVPGPTSGWEHLTFNTVGGHPALKNKLVRRALAYGLDRAALIRNSPFGAAHPSMRPLHSVVFLPQSPFYRPNWSRYGHNPRLARQLLEQAGCRRGADGVYSCDGERLRLRLASRAGLVAPARVDELVQAQLGEIGVEVLLEYSPPLVFVQQILPSGNFDLAHFSWFAPWPDPSGAQDAWACGEEQNFGGYCQRLATRELKQVKQILSARDQAEVLNRADALMAMDVPLIPLYQLPFPAAVKSHVRDFTLSPFNPLGTAEDWWLAQGR